MNTKLHIVIATNIFDIGGAERTVQTLALYLDRTQFEVTVLCMERGGPRATLLEEKGIRVLIGDGTIQKIKELMPNPTVDILHFHRSGQHENTLHNEVVDYLRPKKLMETNIFAFTDATLGPRFDLQVYKSMMMLCERVWKGEKKDSRECLKQRVIYNPVTVEYFDQFALSKEQRQEMRQRLGVNPTDILIGRVGRNDSVKWGDLILSALPDIFRTEPHVKVLFRTIPSSRLSWLKKKNFFDGRVIVLPESSDEKEIAETYQLLDIYVHTSRRGEAFGNSLNEAMVWSLPIIVENTPHWDNGQLEQVEHGVTGWVVQSVGGLTGAVLDLVHDTAHREEFGTAGRRKVAEDFGWKRGVAQYALAYHQLAGLGEESILSHIFPSAENIVNYHERYKKFCALDFPHQRSLRLHIRREVMYWYWRVIDSLVSRGFKKV
ncbi:MAG TPA: glycosyltransferase family 4 protein [Candidatus Kapabacteria bacterium]|nr:glycosyltransferase family 4 protein [Candidatus Kapabacteria bacterium]